MSACRIRSPSGGHDVSAAAENLHAPARPPLSPAGPVDGGGGGERISSGPADRSGAAAASTCRDGCAGINIIAHGMVWHRSAAAPGLVFFLC